ncbi:unnamed protein product [Didymodactylos carnosus]|uniref:ATP synthase F1 complex delta/epsilon subunit N-terminal domain-containing protein n=1 Tax=Didymodactylos carnosus TaxID=1234261 RepID=A0A814MF60_9BILA|nr:unnamed protein product [Didymodactylos carnosus]CAF1078113.1 unnamed protein product [Didymodactylos carnosus]CAF3650900.1 unnamed protein product [Didymodactylos carnosus]CAF3844345.1 unnamed protein product [Didymodactylos carnosus]
MSVIARLSARHFNTAFRCIAAMNSMTVRNQGTAATPATSAATSGADMVFYNQSKNVKQIDVPSMSGNMGILGAYYLAFLLFKFSKNWTYFILPMFLAHHVPILGVLKPGVVAVIENDGTTKRYFVSSGSIAVHQDSSVQLLAEEAIIVENLDTKAAQDTLSDAQRKLQSAKDEREKAEAQIEIECAEAAIKASQGVWQ